MVTTITREMFSIIIEGPRAEIRIWRRPDLDSADGTRNAAELAAEGEKLPARGVREVLLDIRTAPAVAGPKSGEAIAGMLKAWSTRKIRVAVVVGDDPLKTLQFSRLVTDHAPRNARVIADMAEAETWLGEGV